MLLLIIAVLLVAFVLVHVLPACKPRTFATEWRYVTKAFTADWDVILTMPLAACWTAHTRFVDASRKSIGRLQQAKSLISQSDFHDEVLRQEWLSTINALLELQAKAQDKLRVVSLMEPSLLALLDKTGGGEWAEALLQNGIMRVETLAKVARPSVLTAQIPGLKLGEASDLLHQARARALAGRCIDLDLLSLARLDLLRMRGGMLFGLKIDIS